MSVRRVRPVLLVLLWIWAGCIFLVLDLFVGVPALDRVRPDRGLYRGMRVAAHRLIGTPLESVGSPVRPGVASPAQERPSAPAGTTAGAAPEKTFGGSPATEAAAWHAARMALEHSPETSRDGARMNALRKALHGRLLDAHASDATVEMLLLAREVGDDATAQLCVALLHRCGPAATLAEERTRLQALRCVARHGDAGARSEASRWLTGERVRAHDPAAADRLAREQEALLDDRR